MKHHTLRGGRSLALSVALLLLVSCSRSPAVGERFTLWEDEAVRVKGTGLTVEIATIAYQQPGSQTAGDGFVDLRVAVKGEGESRITLVAGEKAQVGEYEIRVEKLVTRVEGEGCKLVIARVEIAH